MKEIRIYSLHPKVYDVKSLLSCYRLEAIADGFAFIWEEEDPDYLIVGEHIYTDAKLKKRFNQLWSERRVLIFYTQEAMKPDLNIFDYGVAFDTGFQCDGRIIRLPPPKDMYHNFYLPERACPQNMAEAKAILAGKTGFCNFMYSHPAAKRDEIFHAIGTYKKVDSLGKHLHNTHHQATGFVGHYKETTLLRLPYKFTIAAENAQYNGYTSEKLMTALQANTVPVYWGNPLIFQDYNESAFINANAFGSLGALVQKIRQLDESDELWCEMVCRPWQTKEQLLSEEKRINDYRDFFIRLFSMDVSAAKRTEKGLYISFYGKWFEHSRPKPLYKRAIRKIKTIVHERKKT